ncbi:MAG: DAK2 domain-containing protein [Chloroflexi bacterium]|nr:DAK2 domain-containing protein [Chloroflexota bacterium]MCL5076026.1 DAK2 domain-containing protein [Chloroflexota bacterium]
MGNDLALWRMTACDGQTLKESLAAATTWLEQKAEEVNLLNVFPVPDGDTGTNMLLTMQAALRRIDVSTDNSIGAIIQAVSYGALMGARGNSGVILSQFLRGLAKAWEKREAIDGADLASGFSMASAMAYKGVIKPVEGTMLTVSKDIAEAAMAATKENRDLLYVLEAAVRAAKVSVARTPTLLSVLREAGVVDAGGEGLFIILEGILRHLRGERTEPTAVSRAVVGMTIGGAEVAPSDGSGEPYGYCTEFVLCGKDLDIEKIRSDIVSFGDSALVVGDDNTVRVHIHTFRPGLVIDYAVALGTLHQIKVDNMQEQHRELLIKRVTPISPKVTVEQISGIAIVAVAAGTGMMEVFQSLGATAVIPGGQTMNPSTEELLQAIEGLPTAQAIILPNNSNILPTAQQAQAHTSKTLAIVPTTNLAQGIAALLAFNLDADLAVNAEMMEKAARSIKTAEITRAVRSTRYKDLQVEEGQPIALVDGELAVAGGDELGVVEGALRKMWAAEAELITIYYGETVGEAQAEGVASLVRAEYPQQRVELVEGGQPFYSYIISVE